MNIIDKDGMDYPGINPEKVLTIILESLQQLVSYELAVVMSYGEGDYLKVMKAHGPLYIKALDRFEISLSSRKDIAGLIGRKKTHLFSEDEKHLDTYYELIDMPDNHSCLVSPLYVEDKPVGLLTLDHSACGMFTRDIVRLVENLSGLIALSLSQIIAVEKISEVNKIITSERNNLLDNKSGILGSLIGESDSWNAVKDAVKLVAAADSPVLIEGETGSGKEVVARALHSLSARSSKPFVAVNCSAISHSLAESEIFGHEKGSFTGAYGMRKGKFELAEGGTLFLDEVGDLPSEIQPKLLRVLQEHSFERVGGEKTIRADVRIIAATNIRLREAVRKGRFREDLYYRLSVFPVYLPPLRERRGDIILLADYFIRKIKEQKGISGYIGLTPEAAEKIAAGEWRGNARELQNAVERAVILSRGGMIEPCHLDESFYPDQVKGKSSAVNISGKGKELDTVIKRHIESVLAGTNGRIYGKGGAAEVLGIKPTTLQSKIKKLDISR